ncbi:MAG: FkbM family methyltransferase [Phycisphaerales bacterium]|jgi:FkbM family methyltransferase
MKSIYELRPDLPRSATGFVERVRSALLGKGVWRRLRPRGEIRQLPDGLRRTRQRLFQLEAQLKLSAMGRRPRGSLEFRAQHGEDALLWELLGGQTEGLCIECGAFDGLSYSVTSAFDAMGWDSLLVEAIPDQATRCATNRPHARVEHAALCGPDHPSALEFTVLPEHYGGMFSFSEATGGQDQAPTYQRREKVSVPATTMDKLLEKNFPGRRVDFAVIDVEGGEVELLRGFDLARWKPRVLVIEDNSLGRSAALPQALAGQPYEMAGWLAMNRVYVHREDRGLMDLIGGKVY